MKRILVGVVVVGVAVFVMFFGSDDKPQVRRFPPDKPNAPVRPPRTSPFVVVLGIAQDAGYPQAGCKKDCCTLGWNDHARRHLPSCLGIVDPISRERWMLDCTPGFPDQLRLLDRVAPTPKGGLTAILLTHAHIGHYTGLIHLGREVMGAKRVPVFAMPRMRTVLTEHAPWSQLVALGHIDVRPLIRDQPIRLNERITITPMLVPHRGELSETVAFRIEGPTRTVLYLPDIDKWQKWDTKIESVLQSVDVAFLDGTFFGDGEIPGRNMADIPHPFIEESIRRFRSLDPSERAKIHFLHLNHTNPAIHSRTPARRKINEAGHHIAKEGAVFGL